MPDEYGAPFSCHRCGLELTPGEGSLYIVRIEALADPIPPKLSSQELEKLDFDAELRRIIDETQDMTSQELMDQVYRRLVIHLCRRCYELWIEDPTG